MKPFHLDTSISRGSAWGITPQQLEKYVRVVSGGGGFRSNDLTVTATNRGIYVIEYDGKTWLCSAVSIKSLPEDYEYDTTTIKGMQVPADTPTVLEGIRRFIDLVVDYYGEGIVGYDSLKSGNHYFERMDGSTFSINGRYLDTLGSIVQDPEEIAQEYEVETKHGEVFTVSWDRQDIEYSIGDEVWDNRLNDGESRKECVAGYQIQWEDPRESRRVSMTGKITCRATYFYINREKDGGRYRVRDRSETLKRVEPTETEYKPLSV